MVREFQGKVRELMNFPNPNHSTKNSRDSGSKIEKKENLREKIWVYLARLSFFSEILENALVVKKAAIVFSQEQSVKRMRNILEEWHTTTV